MDRFRLVIGSALVAVLAACATPRSTFPQAGGTAPGAAPSRARVLASFRRSRCRQPTSRRFNSRRVASRYSAAKSASKGLYGCFASRKPSCWMATVRRSASTAPTSFEHDDGSRLVSTIAAYDEASKPTDLRWLLLTTRSFGKGALENVSHVQRVNTAGGMPPAHCQASQLNQLLRVDFTSDFVFYRPRGE